MDEAVLPPEYQRVLPSVRQAGAPVATPAVGETLRLDTAVRGKLEPLREKLTRLADRGWLRKQPDGRYAARPYNPLSGQVAMARHAWMRNGRASRQRRSEGRRDRRPHPRRGGRDRPLDDVAVPVVRRTNGARAHARAAALTVPGVARLKQWRGMAIRTAELAAAHQADLHLATRSPAGSRGGCVDKTVETAKILTEEGPSRVHGLARQVKVHRRRHPHPRRRGGEALSGQEVAAPLRVGLPDQCAALWVNE
ncbi:hypothetical protein [Streptomyces sp. NPDC058891]|uniref:hypothetical protein n=1 Tax=Streptomyces sp. NPDC058891 TaxID=3346667 RepID=UPI00369F044E